MRKKPTASFTDVDMGYDAAMKGLVGVSGMYIKAGLLEGSKRDDGLNQAEIGAVHEFGSKDGNIPSRSFIRSWLRDKKGDIQKMVKVVYNRIVDGKDPKQSMKLLGKFSKDGIVKQLLGLSSPPLSAKWIAKKKSSKLLIDTGSMMKAINYKVFKKKGLK